MKWNEIKKHFAQVDGANQNSMPSSKSVAPDVMMQSGHSGDHTTRHIIRWIFLVVILIIIILGIITLIQVFKKDQGKVAVSAISQQDFKTINTFLDQNPPKPLTKEQNTTVNSVLDKPVTLNSDDVQMISNVLNSSR